MTSSHFRETRSAQTPPTSRNATIGISRARKTKPRSEALPIRRTANASATCAMPEPSDETVPDATIRARFRSRSAARAADAFTRATIRQCSRRSRGLQEASARDVIEDLAHLPGELVREERLLDECGVRFADPVTRNGVGGIT